MSTVGGHERARTIAGMVAVVVLGLAVALGVFIAIQSRPPSPPEDVPRALAIPAVYATIGLLAMLGAVQRRPTLVVAAGVLCLIGAILSVATFAFAVPGLLLILLGSRVRAVQPWHWSEAVIGVAAVVLVVGGAVALLGMTEGRCWQATGSRTDPTNTWVQCGGDPGGPVGGSQGFASGYSSAVLTTGGGLVEAGLLLGALTLVVVTGRSPTRHGIRPSVDQGRPR